MSIPKSAKKVFNGTVFDIYQWKQKLFDGEVVTFERAKRLDGASTIATVGNKIVIEQQQQPRTGWYTSLPGGYFDHPKEKHKDAALRELLEETGLKPKKMKLWKSYEKDGRVDSKSYIYIAQDCKKVSEPKLDGGERIKIKLVTFEQFLKISDDPTFHFKDLKIDLLQARIHSKKKAELKKAIFG